jgi:hypothetical protein
VPSAVRTACSKRGPVTGWICLIGRCDVTLKFASAELSPIRRHQGKYDDRIGVVALQHGAAHVVMKAERKLVRRRRPEVASGPSFWHVDCTFRF